MKLSSSYQAGALLEAPVTLARLRWWRLDRHLSQVQLAERAGVTQAAVSQLERGLRIPTLRTVVRLAKALSLEPAQLLQVPSPRTLSREAADHIGRAIVSGHWPQQTEERRLARTVGSLVIQKLRSHRAPGRRRFARNRWATPRRSTWVRHLYGPDIPRQILQRVDALLAMGTFR